MLGTYIVPSNKIYPGSDVVGNRPDTFDGRATWANIDNIRDQGQCGSCWAFGAAESFSDRVAINSGSTYVKYSPEDMVSCDTNNYGCQGGYMDMSWEYIDQNGLLTEACFPYTAGASGRAPACATSCKDGSKFNRVSCTDGSIRQSASNDQIESELLTGPVEAAFTVYADFFNYKSGIYTPTSSDVAGGHAIKLLGYGTENGTPYWLAANSWGASWGMAGYFKIARGTCGIEDQVFSCTPDLTEIIQ